MTDKVKLGYLPVNDRETAWYVRRNGFFIGMVWKSGERGWGGSRYNTIGQPEITRPSRAEVGRALAELTDKANGASLTSVIA